MTSAQPPGIPALLRREAAWLSVGLVLGFVVTPWLLYELGTRTLGPYEGAGAGALTASLFADFARLRPSAWILLLGPLVLLYALRLCLRAFRAA